MSGGGGEQSGGGCCSQHQQCIHESASVCKVHWCIMFDSVLVRCKQRSLQLKTSMMFIAVPASLCTQASCCVSLLIIRHGIVHAAELTTILPCALIKTDARKYCIA